MQTHLRKLLPDFFQRRDMILVGVSQKEMTKPKLILFDEGENWACIPPGIKQASLTTGFIPNQETVYGNPLGRRRDGPQLAPKRNIDSHWRPALGEGLDLRWMQT